MRRVGALLFALGLLICLAPGEIALCEGEQMRVVIIMDLCGAPEQAQYEPWLGWPCLNPHHRYFRPMGEGEPDTTVSFALSRRFIGEKGALEWKPWNNHYAHRDGAFWHIEETADCYDREDTVRLAAMAVARGLLAKNVDAALIWVGGTGDARYDVDFTADADRLIAAIAAAPCPNVRDRADAIMRAATLIAREGGEGEKEGNVRMVFISGAPSDAGPYEARAKAAARLLMGEGNVDELSFSGHSWETVGRARAKFALMSVSGAHDPLFNYLHNKGAPLISILAGENAHAPTDRLLSYIKASN